MNTVTRPRATAAAVAAALLLAAASVAPTARTLASAPTAAASSPQEVEKYRVFCVNGKVDFGSRTLQEMQWDFGKNVCLLGEFNSYHEAKEDVRRRGGVGADCRCQ